MGGDGIPSFLRGCLVGGAVVLHMAVHEVASRNGRQEG